MNIKAHQAIKRRELLRQSFLAGGLWASGMTRLRWPEFSLHQKSDSFLGGTLLGVVPFSDEGRPPMGEALGSELDGRLFTDLSTLSAENPVTPTQSFYIRTRVSRLMDTTKPWTVSLGGLVEQSQSLSAEALQKMSVPMGLHLMECAGNTRSAHFGMMSVADWEGVPIQEILARTKPKSAAARVLISGFDRYASESRTSLPGASWIFTADELLSSHSFLATKMNGQPLVADHGAPLRLVVPGWYGCVCIKWVNEIAFVAEDAPATSQMREYAGRTMQPGVPARARDFRPATLEAAAMPVRTEKWSVGSKIKFRVIGIQWGGSSANRGLEIRFNPEEAFVSVDDLQTAAGDLWSFWSHAWSPSKPGRHVIRLRLKDKNIPAVRLNAGYYERSIELSET